MRLAWRVGYVLWQVGSLRACFWLCDSPLGWQAAVAFASIGVTCQWVFGVAPEFAGEVGRG